MRRWLPLALALWLALAAAALAHPEPGDRDGDLIANLQDNCPDAYNQGQADIDHDGTGDACDPDYDGDGDGFFDTGSPRDNCPPIANPDQADADGNGYGDPCEVDRDDDGLQDFRDTCPDLRSSTSTPTTTRSATSATRDDDNDNRADGQDNCPFQYNPDQVDEDRDGRGPECDPSDVPTPGSGPGSADVALQAGADVADTAAPRLTVSVQRRQRLRAIGRTMIVRVRCSEACAVAADLVLSAQAARRVGLARGRGSVVIARGSVRLAGATRSYVFVDLSRTVARRLARRARVPALLRVAAEDGAGNRRVKTRRLELRR